MISRIPSGLRVPTLALMLALAGLGALNGCNSGTSSDGGPGLKPGHYFILTDWDDFYRFDQYFVVLPGNRWEFVEYGYLPDQPTNLCQVTRETGSYRLRDSSLTLTLFGSGESVENCLMTKEEFRNYPMEMIPASDRPSQSVPIRNITTAGFESEDFYQDTDGWQAYPLKPDPFGFY